jgi:signal transduction histidine kinase/ActR/RegA family two-component response regulator
MRQTISLDDRSRRSYLWATLGGLAAAACQWLIQPLVGGLVPFFLIPVVLLVGLRLGRLAALIVAAIGLANLALLMSTLAGAATSFSRGATVIGLYLVLATGSAILGRRLRLVSLRAVDTEKRLLLAQENTGMGVFELDYVAQTAYLSAGLCTLLGKPVVDGPIPLKQWLGSLDQQHREESARSIKERLARGDLKYEREMSVLLPDGRTRWLMSRITLEKAADGSLVRAYGATVDITDRKELNEKLTAAQFALEEQRRLENDRLIEADQRKDDFLATLAHELRSPLAPIRQAVVVLESVGLDDIRRRKSLQIIERQVKRMALLLEDLLDVSRVSHGTVQIKRQAVSLFGVIDTAIETSKPVRDTRHQVLFVARPEADVGINVDSLRISQVVSNILANAFKYSDERSTISLEVSVCERDVSIRVRDSGIGLSPDQLERVFEMFMQAPQGMTRSQGGLGIGLSLARNLVRLHDGEITAASAGIGQGCTFEVSLPDAVCSLPENVPVHALQSRKSSALDIAAEILIADDNADSAESLAEVLRLVGHTVHVAFDGAQALEIFDRAKPRVVLLDVGMPNMSGLEVARAIRAMQEGAAATLIAISGWGQALDRQNALQAGFDQHLTKPVDPKALYAIISHVQDGASSTPSPGNGSAEATGLRLA